MSRACTRPFCRVFRSSNPRAGLNVSMQRCVSQSNGFAGAAPLPPDKSVAHRAALLAALADGPSTIHNFPQSADPQSTLACLRALGVQIESATPDAVVIHGVGKSGLCPPAGPLDCGNSGTTMRLLAGILAGQSFESTLIYKT